MRTLNPTLALAAIAAAAIATPAFAQDGPPSSGGASAFNGPRAGVILGYDALEPGSVQGSAISDREGASGFLYGGDIGYDKTIGRLVIGAEAEITGSTSKVTNDPFNGLGFGRVKAGRDIYVGGRVGALLSPTTLLYAKAGYTNGRLDLLAGDGTTETGSHFNLDGYRLGAGIEKALTPHTYAKIEYRYSNYGDARLEYPSGNNTNNFSVDTDRHQVAVGVGFRF